MVEDISEVEEVKIVRLPEVWPGIVLSTLSVVLQLAIFFTGLGSMSNNPFVRATLVIPTLLWVSAVVYFFDCLYKIHEVLTGVTGDSYPISERQAVLYSFVPFYNVYWTLKWPSEIIDFLNHFDKTGKSEKTDRLGRREKENHWKPGFTFLAASVFSLGFYLTGLTLAIDFVVLMDMTDRLRKLLNRPKVGYTDYMDAVTKRKMTLSRRLLIAYISAGAVFLAILLLSAVSDSMRTNRATHDAQTSDPSRAKTDR